MADGKWSAGKIVLVIAAVLLGLGILCCGGIWIVAGDKLMGIAHFATDSAEFVQDLQAQYGQKAIFGIEQNDQAEFIVTIGVEDELTDDRVREVQDGAWKAIGKAYSDHGFLPVRHLAVGSPGHGNQPGQRGTVIGWSSHMVSVEELVERTGVPAPKNMVFIPDEMGGGKVTIKVRSAPDAEENPSDEPGGK